MKLSVYLTKGKQITSGWLNYSSFTNPEASSAAEFVIPYVEAAGPCSAEALRHGYQ
jgi:hypothetical protein